MYRSTTEKYQYLSEFDEYVKEKLKKEEAIILIDSNDVAFSKIAQLANIGGATLPSGLKVPDGNWKIVNRYLVKDYDDGESN
tara:strand:- start:2112 stop:2357 length:246 start_codon:yes stop_codon:yes gene_type:complete